MKECRRCGEIKHASAFRSYGSKNAAGSEWVCKLCQNKESRNRKLMTKYGLTFAQFSALLDSQEGRCAICRIEFDGEPSVDHDHQTNMVRGLLCTTCNTGLGMFKDSPERLRGAIKYLKKGVDTVVTSS